MFAGAYAAQGEGYLGALNIMNLASPQSAILSAVIFNALVIIALIPLALKGVPYRAAGAAAVLQRNLLIYGLGGVIVPFIGTEIFPQIDAGQLQLRLRAPTATRLETTEQIATRTLAIIGEEAPIATSMGLVGVHAPNYPVNLIHQWNSGPEEAMLQVQLKPGSPPIADLREKLRARFAAAGLSPDRLEIEGRRTLKEGFAEYGTIDVALDPYPYHGTTSTCESLWMGVPVLTRPGQSFASRVGASLLTAVGLPELIASGYAASVVAPDLVTTLPASASAPP